jgi:hypothetical protein
MRRFTQDTKLSSHHVGTVLLRFGNSVSAGAASAILASAGGTFVKRRGDQVLFVNVGSGRVSGAIQALRAHRDIVYAVTLSH